ncbi:MAG: NADH-quinone oxidoreductase subunit J [Gammaproteobacteria bacterium]|nr:MAG: NADH-quinone oxidoreductase subunit J [Gammaproteobacteria bacterium]
MAFDTLVFYVFAAVLVFAALRVVTCRNPVHAALFLVLAFLNSAGLWLLLEAEFLAMTLVLVYVGAVMVLFLFVVMMLDVNLTEMRAGMRRFAPLGLGVGVLLLVEMALIVRSSAFSADQVGDPVRHAADYSNTKALGSVLYTDYVYAFEIAAVILLLAIIAAIALTLRKRPETRYQDPARQVSVRREDRVRLIKMPAEKRG